MKNNADARPFAGSKQQVYNVSSKQAWLRDHHRSIFSNDNDTVKHAPFGVGASANSNVGEEWVTQQHHALDSGLHASRLNQSPAGVATWPNIDNG